jgi:hypothetical protein
MKDTERLDSVRARDDEEKCREGQRTEHESDRRLVTGGMSNVVETRRPGAEFPCLVAATNLEGIAGMTGRSEPEHLHRPTTVLHQRVPEYAGAVSG